MRQVWQVLVHVDSMTDLGSIVRKHLVERAGVEVGRVDQPDGAGGHLTKAYFVFPSEGNAECFIEDIPIRTDGQSRFEETLVDGPTLLPGVRVPDRVYPWDQT